MPSFIFALLISLFSFHISDLPITNYPTCTIDLVGLECEMPQGAMFPDAIYFKFDGTEWPTDTRMNMRINEYFDLEGYVSFEFDDSVEIQLWDDDTFDPDDHLGTNVITCAPNAKGVVRFTKKGANYKLYYRVR